MKKKELTKEEEEELEELIKCQRKITLPDLSNLEGKQGKLIDN